MALILRIIYRTVYPYTIDFLEFIKIYPLSTQNTHKLENLKKRGKKTAIFGFKKRTLWKTRCKNVKNF